MTSLAPLAPPPPPPEVPRKNPVALGVVAAAVVLGVGALGFGLPANVRADGLERRLDRIERAAEGSVDAATPSAPAPTTTFLVAHADASRAQIRTAFANVYTGVLPIADRMAFIDDPSGVEAVLTAISSGPAAPIALSSRVSVDRITFDSDASAIVRYTVMIDGSPPVAGRTGTATRNGEVWKVSRTTVCTDLAGIGAPCQ